MGHSGLFSIFLSNYYKKLELERQKIDSMIKEYEKVNINDISGYNNYKKYDKISEIILDIVVNSLDKYTGTKDNFTYLITKK